MLREVSFATLLLALTTPVWAQQDAGTLRLAGPKVQRKGGSVVSRSVGSDRTATRKAHSASAAKMMPFTAQSPWLHGFGTRQPVFSGGYRFRPSNYKQALARDSYLRAYNASARNVFWAKYRSQQPTASIQSVAMRPVMAAPQLVSARRPSPKIQDGLMSPIHSIQMAVPRRLDVSQDTQPSPVRHAIQRERTGPLFPLPK